MTLICPPGNLKISETIPPPNMTIASLADALIEAGCLTLQVDAERDWFEVMRHRLTQRQVALLYDHEGVRAYVNGESPRALGDEYEEIVEALLKASRIGKADFFGITLVDMRAEPLILDFVALVAHAVKRKYKAKVAVGNRILPAAAYAQLMRRYPCLDYGVYAGCGESALLEIVRDVVGAKADLFGTVVRRGDELRDYPDRAAQVPRVPRPRYDDRILERYKARDSEILANYDSDRPFAERLIRDDKQYLVVPYVFQFYCPRACAFCDNDNRVASIRKSPDQIIDELSGLKAKGVTGVYFVNSSFNNNYKLAEELCDKMIRSRLNLKWFDCANFTTIDEHLLDKMREAGAAKLAFGMESGSQRLLRYVKKGLNLDRAHKYLKYSHKIGIWNHIDVIAGLPTETKADIDATLETIDLVKDFVDVYTLNPFHLFQNSRFYREPEAFGIKILPSPPLEELNFFYPLERIVHRYSCRFDEIGGLAWADKDRQIVESTRAVAAKIDSLASFRVMGNEHLYLLMCLYDKLGHANKELIRKIVKVLTGKFKPYNLDYFLTDFRTSFRKDKDLRVLRPLEGSEFLGREC